MRFEFPHFPAEFEIPDDWWTEAGMTGFVPSTPTYASEDPAARIVSLQEIAPPFRFRHVPKDFRGFDRTRMVRFLAGIASGAPMPPVDLIVIPRFDAFYTPYGFGLLDGVHRFFGSLAAGFEAIPATTREPFR